eukprot:11224305-Alexandrium_andersonii.AAC.1
MQYLSCSCGVSEEDEKEDDGDNEEDPKHYYIEEGWAYRHTDQMEAARGVELELAQSCVRARAR